MKKTFESLAIAIALLLPHAAPGQQPLAGFIFVNATGEPKPLKLEAAGKPLFLGDGIASGSATSGLGLPSGRYSLTARVEGCEPGEKSLDVVPGKCPTLISYIREIENKETGKVEKRLAFLELPHKPAPDGAYIIRLLYIPKSVSETKKAPPLAGSMGGRDVVLKPLEPLEIEAGKKASFKAQDGRQLETTDLEEPGAYYYILHEDASGQLQSVVSQDKLYVWD